MKKAIAIIILFIGFSQAVNAQDPKSKTFETLAQKDLVLLEQTVTLSTEEKETFKDLFIYKHKELVHINKSPERLSVLSESIREKILNNLSEENAIIIKNNPELLKKLSI